MVAVGHFSLPISRMRAYKLSGGSRPMDPLEDEFSPSPPSPSSPVSDTYYIPPPNAHALHQQLRMAHNRANYHDYPRFGNNPQRNGKQFYHGRYYRGKRFDNLNKKRHSVDALDFSVECAYDVPSFLRTLRLHKYIEVLMMQDVRFEDLLCMSEDELAMVGISTQGARRRMYLAIEKYREFLDNHLNFGPKPQPPTHSHGQHSGGLNTSPEFSMAHYGPRRRSVPTVPSLSTWGEGEAVNCPPIDEFESHSYDGDLYYYDDVEEPFDPLNMEKVGERLLGELLDTTDENLPNYRMRNPQYRPRNQGGSYTHVQNSGTRQYNPRPRATSTPHLTHPQINGGYRAPMQPANSGYRGNPRAGPERQYPSRNMAREIVDDSDLSVCMARFEKLSLGPTRSDRWDVRPVSGRPSSAQMARAAVY